MTDTRGALTALLPWLRRSGAEPFLWGGTLLGHIRDGHPIPWDADVDIGVAAEDFGDPGDPPAPWHVRYVTPVQPWMSGYGVTRGNFKVTDGITRVGVHLMHRGPDGRRYFTFHARLVAVLEVLPVEDRSGYSVPHDPAAALEWYYGSGWRTPDRHYIGSERERASQARYIVAG